jgi:hypothetical protein
MAVKPDTPLQFGATRCNHSDAIEPVIRQNLDAWMRQSVVCADLFCERCGSIIATVYLRRDSSAVKAITSKRKRPAYSEVL